MPDGIDMHRGFSNLDFSDGGEREIDIGSDGNVLEDLATQPLSS
jgi:hypothetical protein